MFVDVDGPVEQRERVVEAFQEIPQRLTSTQYLLLRWPEVSAVDESEQIESQRDSLATDWARSVASKTRAVGYGQMYTGVIRFRVGAEPRLVWASNGVQRPDLSDAELLQRALQVEFRSLLTWGHAIWRPTSYHYQLPSGEHAGAFIRVGDAFRTPRDVRVLSTWLAPRLRDGLGMVADSATLVPLITDLQALMSLRGWTSGRVELLDEYPRTKMNLTRVIQPLSSSPGGVLGLVSVSASGRYRDLMYDALDASARRSERNWSVVVLADKQPSSASTRYQPILGPDEAVRSTTWIEIPDHDLNPLDEATCRWCRTNERAQLVRIDPRTFEALALPGFALMTPDVTHARASLGIWQTSFEADAVAIQVPPDRMSPSYVSRPKSAIMSVLVDVNKLLQLSTTTLVDAVSERVETLRQEERTSPSMAVRFDWGDDTAAGQPYDGVLVSKYDMERPGFDRLFDHVMHLINMDGITATQVVPPDDQSPARAPEVVSDWRRALVFSLGSVTGWNLRQIQLATEDRWAGLHGREISALVIHGRPESFRDWESIGRAFRDRLRAVWLTYIPSRSPMAEESVHLGAVNAQSLSLSKPAREFLLARRAYCGPRAELTWDEWQAEFDRGDGAPDPHSVFWGMPPRGTGATHVRTQSNYGYEVDAVTAYAAIGAAMHSARQRAAADDPRWRVFEMPAISRAYYDGILLAAILRWCEPQETWWGANEREAANVMRELIARTGNDEDRKVLFPELLLAAAQGKIPHDAVRVLMSEIPTIAERWDERDRAPVELGMVLAEAAAIRPFVER
jgi:hypothetical protein